MGAPLGVLLLLLGMVFTIGPGGEAEETRRLADEGERATATVTAVDITGGGKGGSPIAYLDVEFQDDIGLASETNVMYCGDEDDKKVGDEVDIVYLPEDVSVAEHTACKRLSNASPFVIGGVLAIAIGTVLILRGWALSRWKRPLWGVPLAVLGVLFVGTALSDDCYCRQAIYFGAALGAIGVVVLLGSRLAPRPAALPPTSSGTGGP